MRPGAATARQVHAWRMIYCRVTCASQALAPTWDKLAENLKPFDDIIIAKVCLMHLIQFMSSCCGRLMRRKTRLTGWTRARTRPSSSCPRARPRRFNNDICCTSVHLIHTQPVSYNSNRDMKSLVEFLEVSLSSRKHTCSLRAGAHGIHPSWGGGGCSGGQGG